MDGKEHILVLCDGEEEYAQLMTDFLKKHRELPWEIHTYTNPAELMKEEKKNTVAMLVAAESIYQEDLKIIQPGCVVILNESGMVKWDKVHNVNKYQEAENVLKALLEVYVDIAEVQLPRIKTEYGTKFVGIYSPIRRCLQTTFSLTLSQMLAKEHRTLYLNFEHYAGIADLLADTQTKDLADLLYFLTAEKDKFRLRLQTMIQHKGGLEFIPPMKAGQNLLTITAVEWLSLLQKIAELGEYEYVVLDLSENMQGLFDVLRMCIKVFTITKDDRVAQSKVRQYEELLTMYEYEDILEKTRKCNFPKLQKLPEDLEQYTRGELAKCVGEELAVLYAIGEEETRD